MSHTPSFTGSNAQMSLLQYVPSLVEIESDSTKVEQKDEGAQSRSARRREEQNQ